ncbi:MAG: hypothetical protein SF069_13095 [Phycisphaerae bacterium]|nr:hypothetical protein [Phycisphaerae bacterium]
MKTRLALLVGTLFAAATAHAGFGITVGYNAPIAYGGCYAPAPVVYGPAFCPPPVYYAPPVYVAPVCAPVVYRGGFCGPVAYPRRTVVYRGYGRGRW